MSEHTSNKQIPLGRLGIVLIAVTLVTAPALAVGPASATGGTTSVSLDTDTTTIKQGTTTTYDIVVSSASGGVGAAEGQIELSNSDVGTITGVSMTSSAELTDVNVNDDGSSASFRAALMDTQDSGSVTIGTVTIEGTQAGDTSALLSIQALSDESGTAYQTGATPDSSLTVEESQSTIDLNIQADAQTVEEGSTVNFDVTRADTGSRVRATVSVAGTDYSTGVSGTTSVEITEAMISDAGTVSAVASKTSTDDEQFRNDTVTLDVGDSNATQPPAGETVVSIEPAKTTIEPAGQQQLRLVAHNVDRGIGAVNATVSVQSTDVATITDVTPAGSPGIDDVSINSAGKSVTMQLALLNISTTGSIDLATITVDGAATGQTTVTPAVSSLGTVGGSSYTISSTESATLNVGKTDSQPSADTSTAIINLAPMPNGFNKASITVTAPSGTTISAFDPQLTTDNQFRIADGGVGASSITAQSVDLAGNVESTQETQPVFTLTFDSPVERDDLSLTVNNLQNDDGTSVPANRISLSLDKSSVFTSPLPGADVDNPPSDPDGDGLYEDINGDGTKNFEDAIALSFVSASQLDNDSVSALDFDGDGDLDTNDAVSLAFE